MAAPTLRRGFGGGTPPSRIAGPGRAILVVVGHRPPLPLGDGRVALGGPTIRVEPHRLRQGDVLPRPRRRGDADREAGSARAGSPLERRPGGEPLVRGGPGTAEAARRHPPG